MTARRRALIHGALAIALFVGAPNLVAQRPQSKDAAPQNGITIRDETFRAASLARDMKYRIILPAGYASSRRRYPVLYLLHGAQGGWSNWETNTNVDEYVRALPLIVVMPDADESWYTNSVSSPQDRFEDYILKDVMPEVETKFRAIRAAYARAIAGLSMGGYGAVKFALKDPRMFSFAATFSGAFEAPRAIDSPDWPGHAYHDEWIRIFGPPGSPAYADNDVFELAKKADPKVVPYLWISCGTADPLLASNRDLAAILSDRGFAYEYHEMPGAHSWQFWDAQLRAMLPVLIEHWKLHSSPRGNRPQLQR